MSGKKKRRHGPKPLLVSPTRTKTWDCPSERVFGLMMLPMEGHHKLRHRARCEEIIRGGWDSSAENAAKRFPGMSEATIRRSYDMVERSLPPEQRRQKRRRPQ